ncbi:hypothetical protein ACFX13_015112 [Malus domestica]
MNQLDFDDSDAVVQKDGGRRWFSAEGDTNCEGGDGVLDLVGDGANAKVVGGEEGAGGEVVEGGDRGRGSGLGRVDGSGQGGLDRGYDHLNP